MKKNQNRFLLIWFICLLIVVIISINPFKMKNTTIIRYAFWGNPQAIGVEKDIIEAFEKENPGVKIEPVVAAYNDYHTKLLVMIAGGMAPDVFRVNSSFYFHDFLRIRSLRDISSLIKRDKINLALYYSPGLEECSFKGRYYGLPWGTAPSYLAINLKVFREAGIPAPSYDWTWDDFTSLCRKFKERGIIGYADNLEMEWVLPFVWGTGVDLLDKTLTKFTLNQPVAAKRIQELANLIKEGAIADPSVVVASQDIRTRWLATDKAAMCAANANDVLTLHNLGVEFAVMTYPCGPVVKNTTMYKSNLIGISSQTRSVEAAWKFLKFLRSPEGVGERLYCQSKRVPPSVNIPQLWDLYIDPDKYPKNIKELTKLISEKYGHRFQIRSGWNEIKGLVDPQLQKIFSGIINAQDALNEIASKAQEALDRIKPLD